MQTYFRATLRTSKSQASRGQGFFRLMETVDSISSLSSIEHWSMRSELVGKTMPLMFVYFAN